MNTKKISIITPSFNQGEFIEETILSIINQGYSNLEFIVIDGGSTDNSVDIIKKYENHIDYWISEKDNGQSDAINKGFQKATGEIITWINSDDLLVEGTLNKINDFFLNNKDNVGVIYGVVEEIDDKGKHIKYQEGYSNPSIERFLSGMAFSQPSSFFKRKYLLDVGYLNTNYSYGMDYDLFSRLSLNCSFIKVEDVFAKYRFHKSSKSISQGDLFIEDWREIFIQRCIDIGSQYILDVLLNLNLCDSNINFSKFRVNKNLLNIDEKKTLFYFLSYYLKSKYNEGDFTESKRIATYIIKNFNHKWIESEKGLKTIFQRLKYPSIFIKILRTLIRKSK
ncbi:glycosyltransferase family 2 protein [Flammeovirga sp. SubArs3]|uniref:glycosyltransferase family 2 protein n=1 Tax=Flammeovirga sp. SubArs3 TaxID=2995316 RepID=UPI00248AD99A|nr:glycosyltransferase family 2 protein [Flammeovirga sp. SubArs3]